MLRAILVDDEKPSLDELNYQLGCHKNVEIIGCYMSSGIALDAIVSENPDVVFLDISMPKMSGIEMAEMILSHNENIQIVFVTAYNKFAVEAFELNALDYVLKPVTEERLNKTVGRLKETDKITQPPEVSNEISIRCLGDFQIIADSAQQIKWRTKKCQELLAFLVHNRGKMLSANQISDVLWENIDEHNAKNMLYTTIYSLRKSLLSISMNNLMISKINGCYSIHCRETDADIIERITCPKANIASENVQSLINMLSLYAGDYLGEKGYPWAEQRRAHLHNRYLNFTHRLCDFLYTVGDYKSIELLAAKAMEIDPYEEKTHFSLIRSYQAQNSAAKVSLAYQNYCDIMVKELGIKPRPLFKILLV